jgi:hypothetical protein
MPSRKMCEHCSVKKKLEKEVRDYRRTSNGLCKCGRHKSSHHKQCSRCRNHQRAQRFKMISRYGITRWREKERARKKQYYRIHCDKVLERTSTNGLIGRLKLADWYVRQLLLDNRKSITRTRKGVVPNELLELKRAHVQLVRVLKRNENTAKHTRTTKRTA